MQSRKRIGALAGSSIYMLNYTSQQPKLGVYPLKKESRPAVPTCAHPTAQSTQGELLWPHPGGQSVGTARQHCCLSGVQTLLVMGSQFPALFFWTQQKEHLWFIHSAHKAQQAALECLPQFSSVFVITHAMVEGKKQTPHASRQRENDLIHWAEHLSLLDYPWHLFRNWSNTNSLI